MPQSAVAEIGPDTQPATPSIWTSTPKNAPTSPLPHFWITCPTTYPLCGLEHEMVPCTVTSPVAESSSAEVILTSNARSHTQHVSRHWDFDERLEGFATSAQASTQASTPVDASAERKDGGST